MDIKSLRAMRNDFTKIASEFDKVASGTDGKSYEDTRFWKPERDKAGNATATIRFLARTEGDDLPWVKVFSHAFKGPTGRWYIENSLTTLGQADPVSELNQRLWNESEDDNSPQRKQVRTQKRKLNYISNILVVNDPKHPENNGKVFLFKYGKKVFDKIMDKARPTFEDEAPVNVFDYWEGANFKLRMKTVDKFPNYDSSEFEAISAVADSDEEILAIAQQQHKLAEFLDPKQFKSYDELKKKLEQVLSGTPVSGSAMDDATADDAPAALSQAAARPAPASRAAPQPAARPPKAAAPMDDDEDTLSYFQSLAAD